MITGINFYDYQQLEYVLYEHFSEKISLKNAPNLNDYRWPIWLAADIEALSTRYDFETVKEVTQHFISKLSLNIDKINWENIEIAVNVRNDWPTALKSTKDCCDLSQKINYSFFSKDLIELVKLHKANRFREKIEDLLDYCNYHNLSSYLENKDYDIAIVWIENEIIR